MNLINYITMKVTSNNLKWIKILKIRGELFLIQLSF